MQKCIRKNKYCRVKKIIPKKHFLVHYPHLIRLIGPLIRLSTLRFERKHGELKRITQEAYNTKNMMKTIAELCQQRKIFEKPKEIVSSSMKVIAQSDLRSEWSDLITECYTDIRLVKTCSFNGQKIREGTIVIRAYSQTKPQFVQIIRVFRYVNDMKFFLIGKKVKVKKFSLSRYAYRIEETDEYIRIDNMPFSKIYHAYQNRDHSYVSKLIDRY